MFCTDCGAPAGGNFCGSCGHDLRVQAAAAEPHPPIDWRTLSDYDALLRVPEVRERITRAANACEKKLTGDEFLDRCDQIFGSVTGGVSLALIRKIAQPISERLGIKTGKARSERFARPLGEVLVELLCALAREGHTLIEARREEGVCQLRARVESTIWTFDATLRIRLAPIQGGTTVEAEMQVPGQLYDWGNCRRSLDALFAGLSVLGKCA